MSYVRCPHCQTLLEDDVSLRGHQVACPVCRGIFQMPISILRPAPCEDNSFQEVELPPKCDVQESFPAIGYSPIAYPVTGVMDDVPPLCGNEDTSAARLDSNNFPPTNIAAKERERRSQKSFLQKAWAAITKGKCSQCGEHAVEVINQKVIDQFQRWDTRYFVPGDSQPTWRQVVVNYDLVRIDYECASCGNRTYSEETIDRGLA